VPLVPHEVRAAVYWCNACIYVASSAESSPSVRHGASTVKRLKPETKNESDVDDNEAAFEMPQEMQQMLQNFSSQ